MSSLQQQLQSALGDAYLLESELGGGGMSRVFLAHETAFGRQVVIKVLLPELAAGVSVDRFRREIQLAARLQHPHIVPLLTAGESDGLPYFIMPYVVGESLRTRVMRVGELPIAETVRLLRDVVSALSYAHSFGVVHRDIKPDNVLVTGGIAVVTDFGVAKAVSASSGDSTPAPLTSLGLALGTPAYMAPEQASGDAGVDHRADIYALGVMAYEMLTGRPPFLGRSAQATLAAHVLETPEPVERLRPAVSPTLANLVTSCLAKRPADRPQSAAEVLHALDAISTPGSGTIPTTAVSLPALAPTSSRRHRAVPVIAAASIAGALLIALVVWTRREPAPARTNSVGAVAAPPAAAPTPDTASPPAPKVPAPAATEPAARVRSPAPHATDGARKRPAPKPEVAPAVAELAAPRRDTTGVAGGASAADTTDISDAASPAAPVPPPAPVSPPAAAPSAQPQLAPAAAAQPPAAPPPPDPAAMLKAAGAVIAEYARAVESERVENLRKVYPTMTAEQQEGWEQFFGTVRNVKSQLAIQQSDFSGDAGSVLVAGLYTYENESTHRAEQQRVSFRALLRRSDGAWRIVEIR